MRISITPPTTPPPQYLRRMFSTDASRNRGPTRHRESWSLQPTTTNGYYTAATEPPQRPMLVSAARDQPDTHTPWPAPPRMTIDIPSGAANAQTPRWTLIPYSPVFPTTPDATTMQRRSDPPPLDFDKSPYRCIPLPDTTRGPVILNHILAYSNHTAQNESNTSQRRPVDVHHRHHICAPATNPRLGSLTILLANGRGITIHASQNGHSFVTVGDVLDAIDTVLFGKPSREMSLPMMHGGLRGSCPCLSGTTVLQSLRSRHEWAGLTRNKEGFDVWDLRIG